MLELRRTCEHCGKSLPPAFVEGVICSLECTFCTFCTGCAAGVLGGVCPNCGGNFSARPIRPSQN